MEPDLFISMVSSGSMCASIAAATASADANEGLLGALVRLGGEDGLTGTVKAGPGGASTATAAGSLARLRRELLWDPQQLAAKVLSQTNRPAAAFAHSLLERLQAACPETEWETGRHWRMFSKESHPVLGLDNEAGEAYQSTGTGAG